jgi:hypothetical protein
LAKIFFTDEAIEKTPKNFFLHRKKRYNIPRYKSFTDEAIQLPSILENVSITAILKIVSIKRQDFPANSAEKLGPLRKKVGPIVILAFLVSFALQKKIYLSLCVCEKSSILLGLTLPLERKRYQIINKESIGKVIFYLKLADTIAQYKSRNLRP